MNTKSIRSRLMPVAALALAVPLALSACGDAGDPAEGKNSEQAGEDTAETPTFTFANDSAPVSGQEITLELPEGVDEANERYAQGKILEAVTLTSLEVDSGEYCAIRYDFHYANGGLNRAKPLDPDEVRDPSDTENEFIPTEYEYVADSLYYGSIDQDTDIDVNGGQSQLREGMTKASGELADDYRSAVSLLDCASTSTDDAAIASVVFPYRSDPSERSYYGTEILASAEVAVQEDGTISIVSFETEGLRISSDGTVIEADE